MKYLIRSLKYFAELVIVLTVFILVLMLLKVVEPDINTMFVNGARSLWTIAGLLAVFAAIYPRFGYTSRRIYLTGSFDEILPEVKEKMTERGYVLEKTDGENLVFRLTSVVARITRMAEDRITFTREMNGFTIEGPSKDVIRIYNGFEFPESEQE